MIPTGYLFDLAESEGITIVWHQFSHIDGLYVHTPSLASPVIALSNALHNQERRLRCVLAHELGHHFKTAGHPIIAASSTSCIDVRRNELRATRWAVSLLVPTDEFLECIETGMTIDDLCDHFFVLPEYIMHKAELSHNDAGIAKTLTEFRANYTVVV